MITDPANSRVAARLLAEEIADEAAGHGVRTFSESIAATHAAGLIQDALAAFVAAHAAELDALIAPRGRRALRVLRTAHGLRPLPAAPPGDPQGAGDGPSTSSCGWPAGCRETRRRGRRAVRPDVHAVATCRARRRCSTRARGAPALLLLPARLAPRRAGGDLRALRAGRQAVEVRRRHRHLLDPGPLARLADPGHQRALQRHRAVAAHAGLLASPRSTRAAAARARPASTWRPGTPTSRSSWSCATTPARTPAVPTTSTWPTGCRTSSCAGSRPTASGRCSTPRRSPTSPTCTARRSTRAYRARRGRRAGSSARSPPGTLYGRMMRTLAQTGNGWMTFKDAANRTSNQTARPENVIHLSNLCTEILEVTSDAETAVCNLGSINLAAHLRRRGDGRRLGPAARDRPHRRALPRPDHRPGLLPDPRGRGRQRAVAADRAGRDGPGRRASSRCGCRSTRRRRWSCPPGSPRRSRWPPTTPPPTWPSSGAGTLVRRDPGRRRRAAPRPLRAPRGSPEWTRCGTGSPQTGLRNSLMIAIAPTATIASIAGCYECIEPQVSNIFKRETLSGEFLQVNRYLVADLQARGPVDPADPRRDQAGRRLGPGHPGIPEDLKALYRTAWELPQKALIDLAAAPQAVHRPVAVAQPLHGRADHRQAVLDVRLRLEGRPEDHLLPALAPGHPDRADHRGDADATATQTAARPARPSPAPWRTPRSARPASRPLKDLPDAARPWNGPHPAAHALPGLLRALPGRDPQHLDGRGGGPQLRPAPTWPG